MERMQPCINDAKDDGKRHSTAAEGPRRRPFPKPLLDDRAPTRKFDRQLDCIGERENRAEGEIGDDHRAQSPEPGRKCPSQDRDEKGESEQADGKDLDLPLLSSVILGSLLGAGVSPKRGRPNSAAN